MPKIKCIRTDIMRRKEIEDTLQNATPEMQALLGLLWGFGKRISEVLLLQREEIYEDHGHLIVRFHLLKKRQDKETVYMKVLTLKHPSIGYILPYLNGWDIANDSTTGPLFPNLTRQNALHRLKKLNPNSYLHLFRGSLATEMSEHSYTVQQLMDWFDWSSKFPGTAMGYVRRGPGLTKELSERIW